MAALAKLSEDTFCHEGPQALGVESGIVKTHVLATHIQHVFVLEVLHGVLYPEAHNNGLKKKKKKKAEACGRITPKGKGHTDSGSSARVLVLPPTVTSSVLGLCPRPTSLPLTRSHDLNLGMVSPLWQGIRYSHSQEASM